MTERVHIDEDLRDQARILHDRIASAGTEESEACAECFQHQATQEPCPVCVILAGALQLERNKHKPAADAQSRAAICETALVTAQARLAELEQRECDTDQYERGPRRQLWVSCSGCGVRAAHPAGIAHKPGCGLSASRNGNGAKT